MLEATDSLSMKELWEIRKGVWGETDKSGWRKGGRLEECTSWFESRICGKRGREVLRLKVLWKGSWVEGRGRKLPDGGQGLKDKVGVNGGPRLSESKRDRDREAETEGGRGKQWNHYFWAVRLITSKILETSSGSTFQNFDLRTFLLSKKMWAAQEPLFMWVIGNNICCIIDQEWDILKTCIY